MAMVVVLVGVAIGYVGIVHNEIVTRLGVRLLTLPGGRRRNGYARRLTYSLMYLALGPMIGALAAASNLAWIDLVAAIYAAAIWLFALTVLFFAARRARIGRDG